MDYAHWPLFDSPFAREERGSGRLEIHHGSERYLLDFNRNLIQESAAPSSAEATEGRSATP